MGMSLVAPAQRDIMASSSLGVAALVRGALDAGARRLIVGLGGSATNDGGAGLLVGLGASCWTTTAGTCRRCRGTWAE